LNKLIDGSTPAINTSDVSALGVETELLTGIEFPEPPDKTNERKKGTRKPLPDAEGWKKATNKNGNHSDSGRKEGISNPKFFPEWAGTPDVPKTTQTEPHDEEGRSESEKSINDEPLTATQQKKRYIKSRTSGSKRSQEKEPLRRTFIKSKDQDVDQEKEELSIKNDDTSHWGDHSEPEEVVIFRKFRGTGDWSELELRTLMRQRLKYDKMFRFRMRGIDRDQTINDWRYTTLDIKMPPLPVSSPEESESLIEYADAEDVVLRVSAVSTNDVGSDNDSLLESRSRKRSGRNHHDQVVNKLSTFNASSRPKISTNRHMDEVRINYNRDPRMPDGLVGSTSMMLINKREADKKGKGRTYHEQNPRYAPSISTPVIRNTRKESRTVVIDHSDLEKESDRTSRKHDRD
jgi:hypothetical protein